MIEPSAPGRLRAVFLWPWPRRTITDLNLTLCARSCNARSCVIQTAIVQFFLVIVRPGHGTPQGLQGAKNGVVVLGIHLRTVGASGRFWGFW